MFGEGGLHEGRVIRVDIYIYLSNSKKRISQPFNPPKLDYKEITRYTQHLPEHTNISPY